MKMLKLTRASDWLGSREVWINFDLVESVFEIKDAGYPGVNSRVCPAGTDSYYDVIETPDEIAQMANSFKR